MAKLTKRIVSKAIQMILKVKSYNGRDNTNLNKADFRKIGNSLIQWILTLFLRQTPTKSTGLYFLQCEEYDLMLEPVAISVTKLLAAVATKPATKTQSLTKTKQLKISV